MSVTSQYRSYKQKYSLAASDRFYALSISPKAAPVKESSRRSGLWFLAGLHSECGHLNKLV